MEVNAYSIGRIFEKTPNNLLKISKMHGTSTEKGKQKNQRATTSTHFICMSRLTSNLTKNSINEMKCLTVDDYFGKIIYRPMSEYF